MNEFYTTAAAALNAASIPSSTYRIARALLDLAPTTGYVELSHEATKNVAGSTSWGTVRRHLITLQNAGLIMKWLNHSTRVYFVDYPPQPWMTEEPELINQRSLLIAERAEVIKIRSPKTDESLTNRAEDDHFRAQDDQNRASSDHFLPSTYTHARARSGVELSNDLDQDLNDSVLNSTQPLTPSQEWTAQLLTDPAVDLQPNNAAQIARLHKPAYVVKHVATWWPKRKEDSPGVLVYRLLKSKRQCKPNPHPSEEFLESEFWRTHYALAPDELAMELPSPPRPDRDNEMEFDDGLVVVYTGKNRR